MGHQGDAHGRDRGTGRQSRVLGPPACPAAAAEPRPRGEAVRGPGQPRVRPQAPVFARRGAQYSQATIQTGAFARGPRRPSPRRWTAPRLPDPSATRIVKMAVKEVLA